MKKTPFKLSISALMVTSALALTGCNDDAASNKTTTAEVKTSQVTAQDADKFIAATEKELSALYLEASRAEWIYANFITHDTAELSAEVNRKMTEAVVRLANEAAKFDSLELDYDARRKLDKLKLALTLPAPQD
ncbi:MAG: M2 family metallopeptidase, partial [Pseudomonadota bacterium]|nr:M2 family metallopeptidase [Pseudomonadota bacterium]